MRHRIAVAATVFLLSAAPLVGAEEIKIGGTGNALGTMQLLGTAFHAQNPDVKVIVLPSLGSSGAVKAVPKKALDIGISSRPLTEEESNAGAVSIEYARTPLVFAVPIAVKTTAITTTQIADIYAGKQLNWPDGQLVRPVLRQSGDDNTKQVKSISPAIDSAVTLAEGRPGMPFATTDQEAADKIESTPGAFGVTTLALILSEKRQLRALTLDGVEPTAANAASDRYPYDKHLFFITLPKPAATVARFVAFVRSPAGREILEKTGHWIQ